MISMWQETVEAQRYVLDMCAELQDAKWRMDTTQVSPYGCSLLTCTDPGELARGRAGLSLTEPLIGFRKVKL